MLDPVLVRYALYLWGGLAIGLTICKSMARKNEVKSGNRKPGVLQTARERGMG